MNITSKKLVALVAELHEVNQELGDAAQPLERLSELNEAQREQIAKRLRAGLVRWDDVTSRIQQLLVSTPDDVKSDGTK